MKKPKSSTFTLATTTQVSFLLSPACVENFRELVFFLNNLVCLCKTEVTKEKLTSWSHSCDSWNGFPPCCCLQRLKARSQILAFRCASKLAPNCLLQFHVGWGAGGCVWLKLKRDICDLRSYGVNRPFPNYLWPLFRSESWCSSFHMKISFHSNANEN